MLVTSLIFVDAIDIDKPVLCISFRGCDLLAFLLLILVDCFMLRNFLFGGKYIAQLLSKLMCNRLQAIYVLISDKILFAAVFANSNDSHAIKMLVSSA